MQNHQLNCEKMKTSILDLPEILIKKGLPFAIYSFPGKRNFNLVIQKNNILDEINIIDINTVNGFVLANFNSAKTGLANYIKPDFFLTENDDLDQVQSFLQNTDIKNDTHLTDNNNISEKEYLSRVEYLVSKVQTKELKKIVFSRVVSKSVTNQIVLSKFLGELRKKYRGAFVNLFHIPGVGTWCGASPETLFKLIDDHYYSDSLAGTRIVSNDKEPDWSNKEHEEQQMVSSFIESVLSELGVKKYEKIGPTNSKAGNLYHILTTYKIPKKVIGQNAGKVIAGLHPTPAVCGLPKAEAFHMIQKAEQHQRRYYSGFIGPWKLNGQSQLFVNLRCAELGKNKINIYVGGGLTASSIPEDEYQETVYKSQTLLSVVENL